MQAEEPVSAHRDAGELGEALAQLGGRVLVKTLDGLQTGKIRERPQDGSKATYAPKLTPEDRVIRWADASSVDEIRRTVAAMSPDPGAETHFRGRLLKVLRASPAEDTQAVMNELGPGETMIGSKGELLVGTTHGPIVLEEVQLEGRRRMTGTEFVRGYRPKDGEILG